MSDELNSTENRQKTLRYFQFLVLDLHVWYFCCMFGTFAGCYNSHLVALDQCRETSFLFGAVST